MVAGVKCQTCVYWVKRPGNVYGQCFRHPATPAITTDENGDRMQADVRPMPGPLEWCGEWRGKEKKPKPVELPPKGVRLV